LDTGSLTKGRFAEFQTLSIKDAPSRAKRLMKHKDILISTVRPDQCHYGLVEHPEPNLVASTGFCVISATKIDPHFLYLFLTSEEMTEYLHSIAEGSTSTYPSLKPSDLASLKFNNPPKERQDLFATFASGIWGKIGQNSKQIQSLESIRNILLPKLMSGEVRVEVGRG
jgi:type I restriction enzyme S subunit